MDFIYNDAATPFDLDNLREMVSSLVDVAPAAILSSPSHHRKKTYRSGYLVKDELGPLIMAMLQAQHGTVVESVQVDFVPAWTGRVVYRDADFINPYPVIAAVGEILNESFCCMQERIAGRVFTLEIWTQPRAARLLGDLPSRLATPPFNVMVESIR